MSNISFQVAGSASTNYVTVVVGDVIIFNLSALASGGALATVTASLSTPIYGTLLVIDNETISFTPSHSGQVSIPCTGTTRQSNGSFVETQCLIMVTITSTAFPPVITQIVPGCVGEEATISGGNLLNSDGSPGLYELYYDNGNHQVSLPFVSGSNQVVIVTIPVTVPYFEPPYTVYVMTDVSSASYDITFPSSCTSGPVASPNFTLAVDNSSALFLGDSTGFLATYQGSAVTRLVTYIGTGAPYINVDGIFLATTAGTYTIIATFVPDSVNTVYSNTVTITINANAPSDIANVEACVGGTFVLSGFFFSTDINVFVAGGINCPVINAPTPVTGNQWQALCSLPLNTTMSVNQSYVLEVQNQAGSGTAILTIPNSCAPAVVPVGTVSIFADTYILAPKETTQIRVTYTDQSGVLDITDAVTFNGTAATYVSATGLFSGAAPIGTYLLSAQYQSRIGLINSSAIVLGVQLITPMPILTAIGSGCPGGVVTLVGKYFSSDVEAYISGSNEFLPIVPGSLSTTNNVDFLFNVTLPGDLSSVANRSYLVYATGSNGASNTVNLTIAPACGSTPLPPVLSINGPTALCGGSSYAYTASYTTQALNAAYEVITTVTDVTTATTWTSTASGMLHNNIFNASSSYGTYSIHAVYSGLTAGVAVTISNCTVSPPVSLERSLSLGKSSTTQTLVLPATQAVHIGQSFQFAAYSFDGTTTTAELAQDWLVDGILGGAPNIGTITSTGMYTAPVSMPHYSQVQISAIASSLQGYAIVSLFDTVDQTPSTNLIVGSQINVFLGDGRHAYIPVGQTMTLLAGQYWVGQITELLGPNLVPLFTPSQQITHFAAYPNATTSSGIMYVENQSEPVGDGTFTSVFNIVLGISDPVTGLFESEWDLSGLAPVDNAYPAEPLLSKGLSARRGGRVALTDYAKTKLKKVRPVEIDADVERSTALWKGALTYNKDNITIQEPLQLFSFDSQKNQYTLRFTSESDAITLVDGDALVAVPMASGSWVLQAISPNDNLFESSRTYVLGVAVGGCFYSEWPLICTRSKHIVHERELPEVFKRLIQKIKGKS